MKYLSSNIILLLVLFLYNKSIAQENPDFSAMFYNVESFFDTKDDSTKSDNEFLPVSEKQWDNYKFNDKKIKIAKTIIAAGGYHTPDIIGLAEVENDYCMKQLVFDSPLTRLKYGYIHYESPDVRGIDVALLYKIDAIQIISKQAIAVAFPQNTHIKTRDILYVKLYAKALKDSLHVFINHWPSRRGGKTKSEYKRIFVASILRSHVDSLLSINQHANILIMGDLNDYPGDRSVIDILQAKDLHCDTCLFNYNPSNYPGTYKYQGRWNTLDQIIVSGNLYNRYKSVAQIIHEPFLLKEDTKNGMKPYRTYQGPIYLAGFSDHLPVMVEFWKK